MAPLPEDIDPMAPLRISMFTAALLLAGLAAPGCDDKPKSAADPACDAVVSRILQCDPSAPPSLRDNPGRACPDNRKACGRIDTTTPAGCTQFMGCLYDGPAAGER